MLTMVVPKGARVGGAGHLGIIEVGDREVAYAERRQSVCESDTEMLMLPGPLLAYAELMHRLCSTYLWRMLVL